MTTISNPINEDGTQPPDSVRLEYPNTGKHLRIDKDVCEELRAAHKQAMKDKCDMFMFHDHQFLTSYTKYMLEYIDARLGTE